MGAVFNRDYLGNRGRRPLPPSINHNLIDFEFHEISHERRLAAFQACYAAYVKLRLAGTANRLNVEHRTSNIERRILMALRFIESKTSESPNPPKADKSRRMVLLCTAFFN